MPDTTPATSPPVTVTVNARGTAWVINGVEYARGQCLLCRTPRPGAYLCEQHAEDWRQRGTDQYFPQWLEENVDPRMYQPLPMCTDYQDDEDP